MQTIRAKNPFTLEGFTFWENNDGTSVQSGISFACADPFCSTMRMSLREGRWTLSMLQARKGERSDPRLTESGSSASSSRPVAKH